MAADHVTRRRIETARETEPGQAEFDRLESLFHRALSASDRQRRELVADVRATDPTLCRRLERLLLREEHNQLSAIGPLAAHAVGPVPVANADERDTEPERGAVGRRVGPYRLKERIGRGGMGEVYCAERDDGHYRQTVAVKLVRSGVASRALLERFRAERQILAGLQHPNIARLLDGAVGDDGLPYLVMEYAPGRSITEHCDAERLSIEERLRLFLEVCSAVQYAHRNLIVHRDLKPSNILVTSDGEVKLLDFGIAKLLSPDQESQDGMTLTVMPAMTPQYASPEQVRGEGITTATDVYALGLLLHELLSGVRAQDPPSNAPAAIERVVCHNEPSRPSAAVGTGSVTRQRERAAARGGVRVERLRRRLRGDLDTIVAAAVQKDPARRYASAEQLAADIERHLSGLPVIARADSFRYRAGRFLRRHRWGVAATATVVTSLVLGLALALTGLVRAQRAQRMAEQDAQTASQVSELLVGLFQTSDPGESKGDTVTAREMLDRGVEQVAQLDEQPAVQARLLDTMGRVYQNLGLYDTALPLIRQSLEIRRSVLGGEHPDTALSLDHLARVHELKGEYEPAEGYYLEALAIQRRVHGDDHREVAQALNNLGALLYSRSRFDEAEPMLTRALELDRRALGRHANVANALTNLAMLKERTARHPEAEAHMREAISIYEETVGEIHPFTAVAFNNLGLILIKSERVGEAEPLLRRSLEIRRQLYGDEHPEINQSLSNIASVLVAQEKYEEAEAAFRELLPLDRKLLGPEHPDFANTLSLLGRTLIRLGRPDEALPLLEEAVQISMQALGGDHRRTAIVRQYYGLALKGTGQREKAIHELQEARRVFVAVLGEDHQRTREAASVLEELAA